MDSAIDFPRICGSGRLTASRRILSAVLMKVLRCIRTTLATTAQIRRRFACGIVLVLSLFGGIAADASTFTSSQDHASICDCGPKCRRDRCCCKPSATESNDATFSVAGEAASASSFGVKSLCRMTSRCQDPAEKMVRLNPRTWFGWAVSQFPPNVEIERTGKVLITSDFWKSPFSGFRLERPPRA